MDIGQQTANRIIDSSNIKELLNVQHFGTNFDSLLLFLYCVCS